MKAGIDKESLKVGILSLYNEFQNYVVENKPNYLDEDFDFQNFINWIGNEYELVSEKEVCEHNYVYVTDKIGYGYEECSRCGKLK